MNKFVEGDSSVSVFLAKTTQTILELYLECSWKFPWNMIYIWISIYCKCHAINVVLTLCDKRFYTLNRALYALISSRSTVLRNVESVMAFTTHVKVKHSRTHAKWISSFQAVIMLCFSCVDMVMRWPHKANIYTHTIFNADSIFLSSISSLPFKINWRVSLSFHPSPKL